MAWRIVAQPNGKFARFSSVVDDFTDYDLTYEEAVDLCIERGLCREEAEDKVQRGVLAGQPRFDAALREIASVHGEARAAERLREMSTPAPDLPLKRAILNLQREAKDAT